MVQLVVKGTKFPDEFVYECDVNSEVATVTQAVTHLQNMRHKVKLHLFSMSELLSTAQKVIQGLSIKSTDGAEDVPKMKLDPSNAAGLPDTANPTIALPDKTRELIAEYEKTYQEILAAHKDPKRVNTDSMFDDYAATIRRLTVTLFPGECTHENGEDAAVTRLYELHENPDIDEDYRVHVYHCRAIMDPQWRQNELIDEATAALWFAGKKLDTASGVKVGQYCGNNPKSRLTVKPALGSGPAPSGEPRMSYDDQRNLRQRFQEKREVYATLEESELRDQVVKKARGQIVLGGGSQVGDHIRTEGLRPIYSKPTVTETAVGSGTE